MKFKMQEDIPILWADSLLSYGKNICFPIKLEKLKLTIYVLRDCLCLGKETQAIGKLDKFNNLICLCKESCPYVSNEFALPAIARDNLSDDVVELEEAAPMFPPGALNLWHWTYESLPKIIALESIGYSGKYIVPHEINEPAGAVIKSYFSMFNISPDRLLPSGFAYKINRLMLPQRISGFHLVENMPLTNFLREKISSVVMILPGSKRAYIKRILRRKIVNEEEILPILAEYDFQIMTPEELSLPEQWSYMSNCSCSVMAHGANATLALIQKERSPFMEIFSNRYVSYSNLHTVRLLKLRYYPLVEELLPQTFADVTTPVIDFLLQNMAADIVVDPIHLKIALESLLDQ